MRVKFLSVLTILFMFLLMNISCSKSDSTPAPNPNPTPTTVNVSILALSYSPASVTVKKGTIVTWTNNGGTAHTVTADDNISFLSPVLGVGGLYSFTSITVGTFPYHCIIHGVSMAGTLVVTN